MKLYTIYLDGIDKTGKDSILPYIGPVCKYKYVCNIRGVMTQLAYGELYNRDYKYDLEQQKDCLNVLLTVDEEDWKVRCKMTNEPAIDYKRNCEAFEHAYEALKAAGCPVIKVNTSEHSLYGIAKIIVDEINRLNNDVVVCNYHTDCLTEEEIGGRSLMEYANEALTGSCDTFAQFDF